MLHPLDARLPAPAAVISLSMMFAALLTGSAAGQVPATAPATLLTQDQAVALAVQRNQSLRAQRLSIDQSRADETTAGLKPNPVFTSSNADFPVFTPSQLTASNLANNQTFTESLSYLLERGGKRARRLQVARDTTEVTARTVDDAERQLRFQVGQAFVSVLLSKATLEFARRDLQEFSQEVELNRQRVASGDLAEGDYLKIALQKLQFEQDLSSAEIALVQAKASLRQLVGYDTVGEDYDVVGQLAHRRAQVSLADLQREAVAARPDLQAAEANTRLAANTLELSRANRARDLTLETEYDRNGPVNAIGVGFSIEIPVHDRNQGDIAKSRIGVTQARENESAARITVLTDVLNAHAQLQTNEKVVSLYESGYLEQARQSRDISRYAFGRGAATLLDLLDAERTYRSTELAYRQALAAWMTSVEQVNFAVGKRVIQ
jgi:cobalt-zinc-cadmium efflux system outer membrane protein